MMFTQALKYCVFKLIVRNQSLLDCDVKINVPVIIMESQFSFLAY